MEHCLKSRELLLPDEQKASFQKENTVVKKSSLEAKSIQKNIKLKNDTILQFSVFVTNKDFKNYFNANKTLSFFEWCPRQIFFS